MDYSLHGVERGLILGRGRVPTGIGEWIKVGSLTLKIGVLVEDSWVTGVLEKTRGPVPPGFGALVHGRLVRRCRIGDSGNDLMGIEVLFALDLAPGDRGGGWVAPL